MISKLSYKKYLVNRYPYLEILDILDEKDGAYHKLIEASWGFGGAIYTFPFSTNGLVNTELYEEAKIKAREFLKIKLTEIKSDFAYLGLHINNQYILAHVDINKLKEHADDLLSFYSEDDFKLFNDKERIMLQKGEYEWEVVVL